MIREQAKVVTRNIVPGMSLDLNPFAQAQESARILSNFIPERSRLTRRAFAPFFSFDSDGSLPLAVKNFRYTRAGAQYTKLVVFRFNGKVAIRDGSGKEQEILPANTGFSVLNGKKPFVGQLSNRLFFSDGTSSYVYDGRSVRVWGLARSTTAPVVTAANVAGAIVAATGVKGCFTWVRLDEENNRVHESSRSNINASFVVIGGVDDAVTLDVTGLTAPSGATHWSGYISELDGSEVYRRTNTTLLTTLTYTATAFPASTTPKAPIRNDPPPPSTIGCVAKNRIFLRDNANPNTWYFSALGEVKGLLNGAADESFCGYGTNSISDISNSDFIPDREVRAMTEHENAIFIFSESKGYAIVGELNLLDNRSPRSIVKLQQFSEGCMGPQAICSTPYGLTWMSTGHRLLLWNGAQQLENIGEPLKPLFDLNLTLNTTGWSTGAEDAVLYWWSGNNRQWLICSYPAADLVQVGNYFTPFIYDFSIPTSQHSGSWSRWDLVSATCIGEYQDPFGERFLLMGGDIWTHVLNLDVACSPAHLDRSFVVGKTYPHSAVVSNPKAVIRTSLQNPSQQDVWTVINYLTSTTGDQVAPGVPAVGTFTEPTITSWIDVEDPDTPGTGITLALDSALTSAEKRAWFVPQAVGAGNNVNIGGALCKTFIVQMEYASGTDSTGNADGRQTVRLNSIYKLGYVFVQKKEMSR